VRRVQDQILDLFPEDGEQLMQRGGLQITTTLDYEMQQWAEIAIQENYRNILDL
jgi:membrane peptidoglycan carboxypeptidase